MPVNDGCIELASNTADGALCGHVAFRCSEPADSDCG